MNKQELKILEGGNACDLCHLLLDKIDEIQLILGRVSDLAYDSDVVLTRLDGHLTLLHAETKLLLKIVREENLGRRSK